MTPTRLHAALTVGLVLLAGCGGGLAVVSDAPSPSAAVESGTETTAAAAPPTTESTPEATADPTSGPRETETASAISVVNERSLSYTVSVYVFRDPSPVLDVTFADGRVLTRPVNESVPLVRAVPFVHWNDSGVEPVREVSSIRPARSTAVAKWSATVGPNSTLGLPTPVERRNVTLLVVVETTATERPLVYTAAMERCEPPRPELEDYRLTLQRDRNMVHVQSDC